MATVPKTMEEHMPPLRRIPRSCGSIIQTPLSGQSPGNLLADRTSYANVVGRYSMALARRVPRPDWVGNSLVCNCLRRDTTDRLRASFWELNGILAISPTVSCANWRRVALASNAVHGSSSTLPCPGRRPAAASLLCATRLAGFTFASRLDYDHPSGRLPPRRSACAEYVACMVQ